MAEAEGLCCSHPDLHTAVVDQAVGRRDVGREEERHMGSEGLSHRATGPAARHKVIEMEEVHHRAIVQEVHRMVIVREEGLRRATEREEGHRRAIDQEAVRHTVIEREVEGQMEEHLPEKDCRSMSPIRLLCQSAAASPSRWSWAYRRR